MRIDEVKVFNFSFMVDMVEGQEIRFGIPAKDQKEAVKKLAGMLNKIIVELSTM